MNYAAHKNQLSVANDWLGNLDDGRGGKKLVTIEKMMFPRYHQLDAVRTLIAASRADGAGHTGAFCFRTYRRAMTTRS